VHNYYIHGMPDGISEEDAAVCRSRFMKALYSLKEKCGQDNLHLRLGSGETTSQATTVIDTGKVPEEISTDRRYIASNPIWRMEQLVVPLSLLDELQTSVNLIELETQVFDEWGLRDIEPFPRSALNFHGAPGTGKTLAAHAVAADLHKKILVVSYAEVESMYHGEGPKNVDILFREAQQQNAVLFIDEADSLLSRRFSTITQGVEQSINAMRSQLLICLEQFKGVVIFATNLVETYDPAFETRVRHIYFPLPDKLARAAIWQKHMPDRLPLYEDVNILDLSELAEGLCGRDIKNVVVDAALKVAGSGGSTICQRDFVEAVSRIMNARTQVRLGNTRT